MNTFAGSIDKQLMLDTGLASVLNPTTLGLANTFRSGDAACNTTLWNDN